MHQNRHHRESCILCFKRLAVRIWECQVHREKKKKKKKHTHTHKSRKHTHTSRANTQTRANQILSHTHTHTHTLLHIRNLCVFRYKSKKKAFKAHEAKYEDYNREERLDRIKKYCSVIRVLAHTQVRLRSLSLSFSISIFVVRLCILC